MISVITVRLRRAPDFPGQVYQDSSEVLQEKPVPILVTSTVESGWIMVEQSSDQSDPA
jgi:hypothetical protein